MNDLKKAAEMALEDICGAKLCEVNSMSSRAEMLRLMDKAAEVLRQALNETPPCKTDPRAPHGFDRNASHNADRYVCECEGWVGSVDNVDISEKRVHKSDKSIHEPVAWMKEWQDGHRNLWLYKPTMFLECELQPLYLAPPKKEWVGLTYEEICDLAFSVDSYKGLVDAVEAKLKEKNGG